MSGHTDEAGRALRVVSRERNICQGLVVFAVAFTVGLAGHVFATCFTEAWHAMPYSVAWCVGVLMMWVVVTLPLSGLYLLWQVVWLLVEDWRTT